MSGAGDFGDPLAVRIIARAMEDSDDDGWAHLGTVGSRIQGAVPDFDPRTYGCPNLSTLVTKSGGFEVLEALSNTEYRLSHRLIAAVLARADE